MMKRFNGFTFNTNLDGKRLTRQLDLVLDLMSDSQVRTIPEIKDAIRRIHGKKCSENGIAARLRDLRKSQFGRYTVDRVRLGDPRRGLFGYRVRPPQQQVELELFA